MLKLVEDVWCAESEYIVVPRSQHGQHLQSSRGGYIDIHYKMNLLVFAPCGKLWVVIVLLRGVYMVAL